MSQIERLRELIGDGHVARGPELAAIGIGTSALARLAGKGTLERVEGPNGILIGYRLPIDENAPDMRFGHLAEIAARHPSAVLCLGSALRLHGMTDDLSGDDHAAVGGAMNRRTEVPSLRLVRWANPDMLTVGVDRYVVAGLPVRATNPARTVADMFRAEHGFPASDRVSALRILAEREGEDGLKRAGDYAAKLEFASREFLVTMETTWEMLAWHATPKP